jgi:hypothetical protein
MPPLNRPDHERPVVPMPPPNRPDHERPAFHIAHRLLGITTLAIWCRRSLAPAVLAASLITGVLAVQTPTSVSYAALTTITIDGIGSDWAGTPVFTESGADAGGGSGDITAMQITNDATNIYVRWNEILTANKNKIASDGFSIAVNTSGGGGTDAIGWVLVNSQGALSVAVEQPIGTRTVTGSAQQSCNVQVCANGAAVFLEAAFPRSALGATGNRIVGIAGRTQASNSFNSNVKDCIPGPATCSGFFSLNTADGTVTVNAGDTTVTTVSCIPNPDVASILVTCTATITDSTTPANVPTGGVTWATTGSGSFGSSSCTLSSGACQVSYTPGATGTETITASYSGDTASTLYKASSGTTDLAVGLPTNTPTPTSTATTVPSTDTPTPTSTATTVPSTDTPTPTSTATTVPSTDTPTPTSTATTVAVSTDTPLPTATSTAVQTATQVPTGTPVPTETAVATALVTPAASTSTPLADATGTTVATATAVQGTATPPSSPPPPPPPPGNASAPSSGAPFHPAAPQLSTSSGGEDAPPQSVQASAQTAIDLGSFAAHPAQGPWTVVVDWGDGSSQTLTVDQAGGIGGVPHTYTASGTYTVVTTVADRLGLSGSGSFTVRATSRPPTSTPAAPPTQAAMATATTMPESSASVTAPANAVVGEAINVSWTEQPLLGGTLAMYPAGQPGAAPQTQQTLGRSADGTLIFTAPSDVPAVEFRLYADTGELLATSGITTIGAPPVACAAAQQPRQVVPETAHVVTTVGEQFYTTTFPCFWVSGPLILSADELGLAPFATDDAVSVDVVRPDGTHASWSFDFSAQCTVITDRAPVDISADLQPGVNLVTLSMNDSCGTVEGSAALYFSVPGARGADGRDTPSTPSAPVGQPVATLDSRRADLATDE